MSIIRTIPEIGQGATIVVGSDRYACTVVDITPSGKTVTVQDDIAIRTDSNGRSPAQTYRYERNLTGHFTRFRFTKRGWTSGSRRLVLGVRDHYYDYDF